MQVIVLTTNDCTSVTYPSVSQSALYKVLMAVVIIYQGFISVIEVCLDIYLDAMF